MNKKEKLMKWTSLLVIAILISIGSTNILATEHSNLSLSKSEEQDIVKETKIENTQETEVESPSSKSLLENVSKKDKRIAELTDKYNDKVYGTVAYYLEVAQKYSLPICFIGITIGAFNFLIIGNKKLDKKEQGFGWIVGFTIGLVVFNVIPLIFALFVAGR